MTAAAEGGWANSLQYTGEHWDADVGLLYLRARWYDPSTGRFLTKDPFPGLAALPQTQNPYVYVGNNPVNLADPSGEIAPIIVAAGLGAAIGAVGGGVSYVLAHPGGRPEDYLRSGGFWQAVGIGAASGAVAGAVGWLVPSLLPASGFWGSVGVGTLSGSLASGAGQVTANLLNPCVAWHHNLGWALATGGITGGIAGGVGYGIRQGAQRVWRLAPLRRGAVIHQRLAQNLPQNFPVIDRFENGVATSIKSIDLTATSYQNISVLTNKVMGYVNTLANWQGARWGGVTVQASQIVGRELLLAIPPGATEAQMTTLLQLQQWATTVGVTLNIVVVP